MSHFFLNTQKSAFRPVYDELNTDALPALATIELVAGDPIVVPGTHFTSAANVIEFIFWGRGDGYTPPDPVTFQIVRWERVVLPAGVSREDSTDSEVLVPVVVVAGTATFGGVAGVADGFITENDYLADEFTVADAARIRESVIYSPGDGVSGVISIDNHGCALYSVYFDASGTDGFNAAYRFW